MKETSKTNPGSVEVNAKQEKWTRINNLTNSLISILSTLTTTLMITSRFSALIRVKPSWYYITGSPNYGARPAKPFHLGARRFCQ